MLTLIMCWIQDFIYITKNTPKKNITKIKIAKKKTLKVKWNRRNTYLLNWWRFTRKLARDCRWKLWRNGEEKNQNLRWKTEEKKKMNWRGGRWNIYGSFTDVYKINYYFNLFCWWSVKNPSVIFEFRTKIFNVPPYFSWSVGKSVGKMLRIEMHLMYHPLEFAQSVDNFVSKIDPPTTYWHTYICRHWRRWLWHFK